MGMLLSEEDIHRVADRATLINCPEAIVANDPTYSEFISIDNGPDDQIRVWRKPHPSGVNEYLVVGVAPVSARTMYQVLLDLEYHTKWDSHCHELRTVKKFPVEDPHTTHDLNYWVTK